MFKLTNNLIDKLDECVTDFLNDLGYGELTASLEDEFAYYADTEEITYTLFDIAYFDLGFQKYVQTNYPNCPTISVFTLSILHELGHHITKDSLMPEPWLEAAIEKKSFGKIKCNTMEEAIAMQVKYCGLYDERIATNKAIEVLTDNYQTCLDFELHFKNILVHAAAPKRKQTSP